MRKVEDIELLLRLQLRTRGVHHLLLLDHMTCILDKVQHLRDAVGPVIQAVGVCLSLAELDRACGPVDLRAHKLRAHKLGQLGLGLFVPQADKLAQPLRVDLLVVLGDDLNVVLDDAFLQHRPPRLATLVRLVLEGRMRLDLRLVRERPCGNLLAQENLDDLLKHGHLVQLLGLERVQFVEHILLLVVVRRQSEVQGVRCQGFFPLRLVLLHALRVEYALVRLANIQELLLMQPILNHVAVVLDLKVHEVLGLQKLWIQLSADDLCPHEVLLSKDKAHLVQDVLRLLSPLHRAESLDLDLLQQSSRLLGFAFLLFDLRKHVGEARLLDFDEDLALGDLVQRADHLDLALLVELLEPTHDQVDHVRCRSLQLATLLRQKDHMLLQLRPVPGVIISLADFAEQLRGRNAV
mmetsp:Transcript_60263/g.118521  ORF Transcript_60263/g.118521 Transcript_60263/m.118521 type:complete len:408 (+) Transcript_60263:99-1322(+)